MLAKDKPQILAVSIDTHEDSKKLLTLLAQEPSDKDSRNRAAVTDGADHGRLSSLGRCQSPRDRPLRFTQPKSKGWPHPATYVIDKQGIVRWKFVEVDYKVRATNDMILQG